MTNDNDQSEEAPERGQSRTDGGERPDERSGWRRLANILGIIILIVFILPFVLSAVPQLIGAEYSYVVLSGSMQPAFGAGDVTFVDAVHASAIEEGDIINYKTPGDDRTTTHRVIEIVEADDGSVAFRTKGDNNENPDPRLVSSDELRGRVMHLGGAPIVIPMIGYILDAGKTGPGFLLLFVVPLTLLFMNEAWNILTSRRGEADSTAPQTDATEATELAGEAEREAEQQSAPAPSSDPAPTVAPDGQESDPVGSGTISFSPAELRLGLGILAGFGAYSTWVAATDPGAFTIGVAGSTLVGLLMLLGLYVQGDSNTANSPTTQQQPSQPEDGLTIRIGAISQESDDLERESVNSLVTMVDLAEYYDRQLYRTPDGLRYHLSVGSTLFIFDADHEAGESPPSAYGDLGDPPADGSLAAEGSTDQREATSAERRGEHADRERGEGGAAGTGSSDFDDDPSRDSLFGRNLQADDD